MVYFATHFQARNSTVKQGQLLSNIALKPGLRLVHFGHFFNYVVMNLGYLGRYLIGKIINLLLKSLAYPHKKAKQSAADCQDHPSQQRNNLACVFGHLAVSVSR